MYIGTKRDGVLGVGLCHEMALLRRIYAYLGRADVVGFFPEKLETVLYSAKESKSHRNRGRRDKRVSRLYRNHQTRDNAPRGCVLYIGCS